MTRIFLVGYMGAGKTTLGKALSKAIGLPFVDLDWYIESRYHQTISDLFARRGEDGFRQLERTMLHEVGEFEDVIISCGGGTPCFFDNMDYMNRQGPTVWLDASTDCLFRRLSKGLRKRPVLQGKTDEALREFIQQNLNSRLDYYARARLRIDSSRLENRQQVADTVSELRTMLGL